MKRLRPVTFLPASYPRVSRPTVPAAFTLRESMLSVPK